MEKTRIRSIESLISFKGVTTSAGAADGSTLLCSDLANVPDYDKMVVVVLTGDYAGQASGISGTTTGGTITVTKNFGGQIASGVDFAVLAMVAPATDTEAIDFTLADEDEFDVADADADNERWDSDYIAGAAGGSADINTTTADRLMVAVDPSGGPATARYGTWHRLPIYADYFRITEDISCTWGSADSATPKAAGLILSKGDGALDANNFLAIERQKGTAINRIRVRGTLNSVPLSDTDVNTTDDAVAFKIERWDETWRFYYSTTQNPGYVWILIAQVEDPSNYMTNELRFFQQVYTPGTDVAESVQGDFGYFRYYIAAGSGGGQFLVGDYDSTWVTSNRDGNLFERSENIISVAGQRDDAAPAMNAAPTDTDTVVMHLKALRETVGQEPADADDSLHTVAGQRDDAAPAMNAAPGDTDTVIKHLKAIRETVGQTSADPDDSILTNLGQRDDAATNDNLSDVTTTSIEAKLRLLLNRTSRRDTFTQEVVGATDVDGTTWKTLVDGSAITSPVRICGFTATVAGVWAGNAKIRITEGTGATKIWPFQDEYVEGTDFSSGVIVPFHFPLEVPVLSGYIFQFRSSDAADGVGKTMAITLDVIEMV